MADGIITVVDATAATKKVDQGEYSVGGNTVERERIEQMEYAPATANITAVDTGHAAITAGTISSTAAAANSSAPFTFLSATGVVGVLITGTWVATLQFEVSVDGTNWTTCNGVVPGSGALASSTTTNGIWRIPTSGFAAVRVRCTAFTSGTVTVAFRSGPGSSQVEIGEALPTGTNSIGGVTANAGTNLNTSLLALESGGNLATLAGAIASAVAQINNKQVNGVTLQTGTGAAGTGTQRVAVASDSSIVLATGAAVIGALTANQSVNAAQVAGTTTDTNSGTKSAGTQRVVLATDQPALTNALKVDGSAVTQPVAGVAASGASVSGNPVLQGGRGSTANPTAVTDGQAVAALFDKLGKQVVVGAVRDLKLVQQTTITSSTSETTIATAVASTFLDLYAIILTNTSATGTKVTIKDSTAGTTRAVIWVPANDTRGFMLDPSAGVNQATVNNNWTATCGTSVASIEVTALAVKNL